MRKAMPVIRPPRARRSPCALRAPSPLGPRAGAGGGGQASARADARADARARPALGGLLALALVLSPAAARAHPHIFIDAGLDLVLDAGGRVVEARVTWIYDAFYTMLLMEDLGLDADFDLTLTEAEVAATLGFDLNWNGGFEGGLHLSRAGAEMTLGAPEARSLHLTPEGRLVSTHVRPVTDGDGAGPVEATIHDPEFYIAFEMTGALSVEGAPCTPRLVRADLDAAYGALEAALAEMGGAEVAEEEEAFPRVGALFADRVIVECDG